MSTLGEKLKHELRELIPVTVFFFGTFQLLALTQALMLQQFGIRVSAFLTATVMALVVAKVVLITDHFPLVNCFSDKPLSYSVAWKTAVYFIASLVVRYVEHLIHFWRQTGNFAETIIWLRQRLRKSTAETAESPRRIAATLSGHLLFFVLIIAPLAGASGRVAGMDGPIQPGGRNQKRLGFRRLRRGNRGWIILSLSPT